MSSSNCDKCGAFVSGDNCYKCQWMSSGDRPFNFSQLVIEAIEPSLDLPATITLQADEFSREAIVWLHERQIYEEVIKRQQIGYVKSTNCLFIPAVDTTNTLRWYQLKTFEGSAEYMTVGDSRLYTVRYLDHSTRMVVIVKDHLSAMRVRPFCNVICLNGSTLHADTIEYILESFNTVIFWLDADVQGQVATYKAFKGLQKEVVALSNVKFKAAKQVDGYIFKRVNSGLVKCAATKYSDKSIQDVLKTKIVMCT